MLCCLDDGQTCVIATFQQLPLPWYIDDFCQNWPLARIVINKVGPWCTAMDYRCLMEPINIACFLYDDVMVWKHFSRYWTFVRGIHQSPVDFHQKGPATGGSDVFFDVCLNKRLWEWSFWIVSDHHDKGCQSDEPLASLVTLNKIINVYGFLVVIMLYSCILSFIVCILLEIKLLLLPLETLLLLFSLDFVFCSDEMIKSQRAPICTKDHHSCFVFYLLYIFNPNIASLCISCWSCHTGVKQCTFHWLISRELAQKHIV